MPINCLINSEQIVKNSCSKNQFMVNSWTIHEHSCFTKMTLSSFVSSSPPPLLSSLFLSFPLFLSFFNVHPVQPANSLKTKDLRKRHFWLKILSHGKPLRFKALGAKFAHYFSHFPADPTLHTPPKPPLHAMPRNPTSCKVLCRICRPNPTHTTTLIIKF